MEKRDFDFGTRLFENPEEALEAWWRQKEQHLEQRYQGAEREKQFWGEFYGKNKDLSDQQVLVRAVALQNAQSLSKITDAGEMATKIADFARREISRIRGQEYAPEDQDQPRGGPGLAGAADQMERDRGVMQGGLEHGSAPTSAPPAQQGGLGREIRRRRALRHAAGYMRPKDD